MPDLRVYQIDAFTTTIGQGNTAVVVANAEGLSDRRMQKIARQFGSSETAFILPSQQQDHDIRIRFFTPTTEVPVCVHASVAAHYVLALERRFLGPCRQLTGAGVQRVFTAFHDDEIRVTLEQGSPTFSPPIEPDLAHRVLSALGANEFELDPLCPVQFASTGEGSLMIGLRRRETLQALKPNAIALTALTRDVAAGNFFAFTLDTPWDDDAFTWGRMFSPAIGIAEGPVTGNADGPLGAYLVKHGLIGVNAGYARYRARQVSPAGRSSWMDVLVGAEFGKPTAVRIQGHAVMRFKTTLPLRRSLRADR